VRRLPGACRDAPAVAAAHTWRRHPRPRRRAPIGGHKVARFRRRGGITVKQAMTPPSSLGMTFHPRAGSPGSPAERPDVIVDARQTWRSRVGGRSGRSGRRDRPRPWPVCTSPGPRCRIRRQRRLEPGGRGPSSPNVQLVAPAGVRCPVDRVGDRHSSSANRGASCGAVWGGILLSYLTRSTNRPPKAKHFHISRRRGGTNWGPVATALLLIAVDAGVPPIAPGGRCGRWPRLVTRQ